MPTGVYKRREGVWPRISPSAETRKKLSERQIGPKNHMYGKTTSKKQKETVRKIMTGNKFRLGTKQPKEWIENCRERMKGNQHTPKGYKWSEEVIEKRKKSLPRGESHHWSGADHSGENNGRWISDRTKLKSSEERHLGSHYQRWMKAVKNRDGWQCRIANGDCSGQLEAHHILAWRSYPELRYEVNNGITLCQAHHPRARAEEKRLAPLFKELVSVSSE